MPIPSPFHSRTSQLCTSMSWKDWGGYYAVTYYDTCHDPEYFAFRHSAGLIDVSPLFKYEVRGPDAAAFLSRLTVKNVAKLRPGRVTYLCWCDDDGKVVDDGTVSCLGEDDDGNRHYRVHRGGALTFLVPPHRPRLRRLDRRLDRSLRCPGPPGPDVERRSCAR